MPVTQEMIEIMLRHMAVARAIEDVMGQYTREHKISGWFHPGEGQEAVAAGAVAALNQDDYLWYQGRGTAWPIAKGMSPGPILADLFGKVTGATGGKGAGIPHWADMSVGVMGEGGTLGSVFPLAAGSAFASKYRKDGRVSIANFGDGTTARGTFHETLMHAAAWKLPLIYFCENNELLVSTYLDEVCPTKDIADFAAGYKIPGVIVDGQDAIAVYETTKEAVDRARSGEGPTLIEAKTTRRRGHFAGDPQLTRKKDAFDDYRDPIDVLAAHMPQDAVARIRDEASTAVQVAYEDALAAPLPEPSVIYKDLYYG
ncbi:MAG: thiamine pyrophosphate-dependent dehydrogenase E1 component subunit alpha [Pseudomonadales bacterium]